ncbi:MAG: hypothetical protein EA425_13325 [Puniceicoccaceae bacterium]|nr:MAG: hypothetical protein EA425_13325 [Puniceicoccaceae bacterium]
MKTACLSLLVSLMITAGAAAADSAGQPAAGPSSPFVSESEVIARIADADPSAPDAGTVSSQFLFNRTQERASALPLSPWLETTPPTLREEMRGSLRPRDLDFGHDHVRRQLDRQVRLLRSLLPVTKEIDPALHAGQREQITLTEYAIRRDQQPGGRTYADGRTGNETPLLPLDGLIELLMQAIAEVSP